MDNKEIKEEKNISAESTTKKPEVPEEAKVVEKPSPTIEEEKKAEIVLPAEKEPEVKEKQKEETPAIVIPEEKEDVKIQGKEMESADFSAMFNVASEETEEKKEEPKVEEKHEETPAVVIPEEKEDVKIQGKEMEAADFSAMFNVASEEVKEEPKVETPEVKTETPEVKTAEPTVVAELPAEHESHKTPRFNSEEKTLYTIKEEKESNPTGVILFFIILAIVIIFLPQLTKTSEAALDKIYGANQVAPQEKEEEKVETKYYYFEQTYELEVDNLTIENAIKSKTGDEYFLRMSVFNNDNKIYKFDKNYYIFLYNENQIVGRTKFFAYDALAPNGGNELSFVINENAKNNANRFAFILVDKNDYPEVQLNTEEDGYKVLTCKYLNDELKYYFKDDRLVKINELYSESKTIYTSEYDKHREEIQRLSQEKYNVIDGFDSVFVDRNYNPEPYTDEDKAAGKKPPILAEFEMNNTLDLVNINDKALSNLKTYKYFSYNESKNVVAYEIQSFGYTCGN